MELTTTDPSFGKPPQDLRCDTDLDSKELSKERTVALPWSQPMIDVNKLVELDGWVLTPGSDMLESEGIKMRYTGRQTALSPSFDRPSGTANQPVLVWGAVVSM